MEHRGHYELYRRLLATNQPFFQLRLLVAFLWFRGLALDVGKRQPIIQRILLSTIRLSPLEQACSIFRCRTKALVGASVCEKKVLPTGKSLGTSQVKGVLIFGAIMQLSRVFYQSLGPCMDLLVLTHF